MTEDDLRDAIAANLSIFEDGLTLLKKEQYLPNEIGTSGFVDIFARDRLGRYVVIEVKISKYSEREAFTELFKYLGLIKRRFNVPESEVRLFIVSTDWRELKIPFSEFYHVVPYNVVGYRAEWDGSSLPKVNEEPPLAETKGRDLVPRHWLQFYGKESDRDTQSSEYARKAKARGISDFVIVHIELINDFGGGFCFYFAQQRHEMSFFEDIFKRHASEDRLEELYDYIDELDGDDKLNELADACIEGLDVWADELEIGHPEKFKGWYQRGNWKIQKIIRFGVFEADALLTDEKLIADLCGLTGASYTWYNGAASKGDRSKRGEIIDRYKNCLYHNDEWRQAIRDALEWESKEQNSTMFLSVFCPEDIIESLYLLRKTGDDSYRPKYTMIVDSNQRSMDMFEGLVVGSGKPPATWDDIIDKFFSGDVSNYFMASHLHAVHGMNSGIMDALGLRYVNVHRLLEGDAENVGEEYRIRGNQIQAYKGVRPLSLLQWMKDHSGLVENICDAFAAHVFYGPGMEP